MDAAPLVAHAFGDYVLQSDWMASNKFASKRVALAHVITYTLPFLLLTTSPLALLFIAGTHFVIDHYRIARYVVFAKNFLAPPSEWPVWEYSKNTGYPDSKPAWLSVWLLIIADNVLHVLCNYAALRWFQ